MEYNFIVVCKRFLYVLLTITGVISKSLEQTYADTLAILNDKMSSDKYNVDVRPKLDQSQVLYVGVSFELLAIVDLNDVSQSFNCNGFVTFFWNDEVLVWDPDSYGGQTTIHPQAKNIWRPRVILGNTLEKRDIFEEDNAPVVVTFNGSTVWFPGSTFPSACALNMTKYPFDEQICSLWFLPMGYNSSGIQFEALSNQVGLDFFVKNGEWELINSSIFVFNTTDNIGSQLSTIMITFHLKRNPAGILINILLPVVFISFLSLTAFLIPVESGEKISYGTTVLMALAVFMTTMNSILPVSSDKLPSVVLYIFILLIISLLTVVTSIIIVFLHHKEEKVDRHLRVQANLKRIMNKVTMVRQAEHVLDSFSTKHTSKVRPMTPVRDDSDGSTTTVDDKKTQCKLLPQHNRYKMIGKYIDCVSLIVFFTAWLSTSLGFLLEVSK